MLTLRDVLVAVVGIGRILRWRADAFEVFDASPRGFWASFWAAAFVLPLWAFLLTDQMDQTFHASAASYFAAQAIGYVASWLAYPLVMVRICDFLDRWPRYFTYMVAYNWFQLVQTLAWLPIVVLMASGAPRGLVAIVWLATHAVLISYAWFIARRGLQVDAGAASALVVIDLLLGLLIDRLAATVG